jgi:hypothetical protein
MRLITEFLNHPILYGLLAVVCLTALFFLVGLALLPFYWVSDKLGETRCPKCRGFFKRKLVDWEIIDEKEVLKTVNRVDHGTIYSNSIFEPNNAIAINRQEQVTFVEQTHLNHWVCKDPLCGHKWTAEEYAEFEGSLEA